MTSDSDSESFFKHRHQFGPSLTNFPFLPPAAPHTACRDLTVAAVCNCERLSKDVTTKRGKNKVNVVPDVIQAHTHTHINQHVTDVVQGEERKTESRWSEERRAEEAG